MFGLFGKKKLQNQVVTDDTRHEALERIVPVVKSSEQNVPPDATYLELPSEHSPIARPLVADLIVMYAEDFSERFEFISQHRMEQLGLTFEELNTIALKNLPNRLPEIQIHGEPPKHMLTCGGNFEATLLLHDGLWDSIEQALPGAAMVAVPARDLLFVSGEDWEGAYDFLSDLAEKELEDKRNSLSKHVFVRKAGLWTVVGLAS